MTGLRGRSGASTARRSARSRWHRRVAAMISAVVAVAALAGCAALPTSGPVSTGDAIKDEQQTGVDYRPNGPVKGSSQTAILKSFIEAATGAQDNYAVAREFLSDRFSQRWNPRGGVTIRQGSGDIERTTGRTLTYTLTASATVDSDGEYTQAVRPTSSTLAFKFTKENGQWRISSAPDGIILSPVSFDAVFQAHALYFYDPTYRYLVPDERWFLARSSTTTRIASALLAGPSSWLKGAVVSAFPEGTELSLNAVTVDNGSAQVDLTSDALRANSVDKARMREQLTASMSSVASVSSVTLTVEGSSVSMPSSSGTSATRDPDVDSRPLIVSKSGQVGYASAGSGTVSKLSGVGDSIRTLEPKAVELSSSGAEAAVQNADGIFVVRDGQRPLRVDTRSNLVAPSLDDQGYVWVGQSSTTKSVTAYGLGGDPHTIQTTLPSGDLVSFTVSRDGTRALALIDTSDGAALYVMSILRDSGKQPTAFGSPVRLQSASGTPVGATWVSDLEVASTGKTGSGSSVVSTVVGGAPSILAQPDGAVTAITGGGGGSLLVRTSSGAVLQQSSGGWDATGAVASVLCTQR